MDCGTYKNKTSSCNRVREAEKKGEKEMSIPPRHETGARRNMGPQGKNIPPVNKEHSEKLWGVRGVEDVFFQREAQITWWSVLGGIAMAALLTKLDSLPPAFKMGKWYFSLYFLATCLVIINSWVQTAWGSLVLKWPISISTSAVIFFQGLLMSVAALNITKPAIWYAAITGVILTALFLQLIFSKSRGWIAFPAEMIDQAHASNWIYAILAIFGLVSSVYLAVRPGIVVETGWGVAAVLLSIFALIREHLGMNEEKRRMGIP
jgi:hypothetical protein